MVSFDSTRKDKLSKKLGIEIRQSGALVLPCVLYGCCAIDDSDALT